MMRPQILKEILMSGINKTNNLISIDNSLIHGKGVFSTKIIIANTSIAYFDGEEIDYDTYHSLTLEGVKIEPSGILKFLNHSCDNNSYFIGRLLYSNKNIAPGEEVTINYLDTEDNITNPFSCLCNTSVCNKKVCTLPV